MSETELYALAWAGVVALWAIVIGLFMGQAGVDPSRIAVIGPVFERIWNALTVAMRKVLRIKG